MIKDLRKSLSLVWSLNKLLLIYSIMIRVFMGLYPVISIYILKRIIDEVAFYLQFKTNLPFIIFLLLLQCIISITNAFFINIQKIVNNKFQYEVDFYLEKRIIEKVSSVPLAYLDDHSFHDLHKRAYNNLGSRLLSPINNVLDIVQRVISLSSFLIFLASIHWILVILSVLIFIPAIKISSKFGKKTFSLKMMQTPKAREANYFKYLLSDKSSAKEIRLFRLKTYFLNKWEKTYRKQNEENISLIKRESLATAGIGTITAVLYTVIAILLLFLNKALQITVGDFVAVLQIVQNTQVNLNNVSQSIGQIYKDLLFVRDLFRFLSYEDKRIQILSGDKSFPEKLEKGVVFWDVSFKYPNLDRNILDNISFYIRPGEKIALVGNNGSGKTTLIKCLIGLYPINKGQIYFDDIPIHELDQDKLRENITVIFQDYIKYNLTVKENIVLGRIDDNDNKNRMQDVSRKTAFDKVASKLSQGYDTVLGKVLTEGEELSEGQWQKLSITRSLFRGGQIYILDEPTSSLDPQSEQEIYEHFNSLTEGKTAVFISHRMASTKLADRIFVLKDGRLVEIGTHDELMAMGGEYFRLYNIQAKWYNSERAVGFR